MIFLYSYHHGNTRKIANAIAPIINAEIIEVDKMDTGGFDFSSLKQCPLIGFGAGIDSGKHYKQILYFAEKLPNLKNQKAFIFSTSAIYNKKKMHKDHKALRDLLQNKGLEIRGEFSCPGFNTNSFLKYFGGMNKGRPNAEDLKRAVLFAEELAGAVR